MTDFSEFKVWAGLIQLFAIALFILVFNVVRKRVPFVTKSLLPASVVAGIFLLILKLVWPWFNNFINVNVMSVVAYHSLALGFISITLKSSKDKKPVQSSTVFNTGLVTCNTYILQGFLGMIVTLVMYLLFKNLNIIPAAGTILAMAFGQGTGQALNWGTIYENQYGFQGGSTFGLTLAAVGFIVACIIGVIYLNILRKKGKIVLKEANNTGLEMVSMAEEEPANEAIDKLTIQLALVFFVYFITFLVMFGFSYLCDCNLFGSLSQTLKAIIWGFNFLIGTIFATLLKKILDKLKEKKIKRYKATNDFMLSRLSGFFFDLMIICGIAAIDIEKLQSLWIVVIVLAAVGTIATFIYLKIVSKYLWKGYEIEGFISMFGMLTGTASTGMILLREIDPKFETPAASNLVYQQVPAIVFGLPAILIVGIAPRSMSLLYVSIGISFILFIIYNIIIFRKQIFKKKNQKVSNK